MVLLTLLPSRSSDIVWHESDWMNDESRFLAFTIKGQGGPDIYVAFNAHGHKVGHDRAYWGTPLYRACVRQAHGH